MNLSPTGRPAVTVAVVALLCAGCDAVGPPPTEEADSPAPASPSPASPSPTAAPTTEEPATAGPTARPTATTQPLPPVWLTADTVGTVELGADEALHDLLVQLGPLDSYAEVGGVCAAPGLYAAAWGDLEVFLGDGSTVQGWAAVGPDLPANVQPPHGLRPGASLDVVRALPDAQDVREEDLHTLGNFVLADGIRWYHADDTVFTYGVEIPYCGTTEPD